MKKKTQEPTVNVKDFETLHDLRKKYGTPALIAMIAAQTDEIEIVPQDDPEKTGKSVRDYSVGFHDESITVSVGMQKQGGSFVQALGELILRGDTRNREKILLTWPNEWEFYRDVGKRIERVRER